MIAEVDTPGQYWSRTSRARVRKSAPLRAYATDTLPANGVMVPPARRSLRTGSLSAFSSWKGSVRTA